MYTAAVEASVFLLFGAVISLLPPPVALCCLPGCLLIRLALTAAENEEFVAKLLEPNDIFAKFVANCAYDAALCSIGWVVGRFVQPRRKGAKVGSAATAVQIHCKLVKSIGHVPTARMGHASCTVGECAYVFGGSDGDHALFDDMHKFDPKIGRWEKQRTSGSNPSARFGHKLCAIGPIIYLVGGSDKKENCSATVHRFDTRTNEWSRPTRKQQAITERTGHTIAAVRERFLIVYGDSQLRHTLDIFDTEAGIWESHDLESTMFASEQPPPMFGIACAVVGDGVLFFGGQDDEGPNTSMYHLTLSFRDGTASGAAGGTNDAWSTGGASSSGGSTASSDGSSGALSILVPAAVQALTTSRRWSIIRLTGFSPLPSSDAAVAISACHRFVICVGGFGAGTNSAAISTGAGCAMAVFDLEMNCWRQVKVQGKCDDTEGSDGNESNRHATTAVRDAIPSARVSASLTCVGGSCFLLVGGLQLDEHGQGKSERGEEQEIVPFTYMHQLAILDNNLATTTSTMASGSPKASQGKSD
jgi:hypothetical protein